jgi:hypothetical protein
MIARCGVTAERQHVDCWSEQSAAPNLASIIKGVLHEFCTLLLVHLLLYRLPVYVDDRTLWRHSRDSMLTAGL